MISVSLTRLHDLQRLPDDQLIEKVAVEVMGWDHATQNEGPKTCPCGHPLGWNPLTDWNHTMEVVDRIKNRRGIRLSHLPFKGPKGASYVEAWSVWIEGSGEAVVQQNLQRAICLAALLASTPAA